MFWRRWAVLTDTFHHHSGVYVLVVLTQASAIHVVRCRVADDVCESSARMEKSVREERSIRLLVFLPPLDLGETTILFQPKLVHHFL